MVWYAKGYAADAPPDHVFANELARQIPSPAVRFPLSWICTPLAIFVFRVIARSSEAI